MTRKRFIAGAICPRCSQLDSIYVYQQDGAEFRACADCDFEEKADFEQLAKKPITEELPTRVNSTEDKTREVDIQPIKIMGVEKQKGK